MQRTASETVKQLPEHLRGHTPVSSLGTLAIQKGNRLRDGSCNFCTRPTDNIHVLRGGNLEVRVCDHCLRIIQEYQP